MKFSPLLFALYCNFADMANASTVFVSPKKTEEFIKIEEHAKATLGSYWHKEDGESLTDFEEWTIHLENDNSWKDPSEAELFFCNVSSAIDQEKLPCQLYRFSWKGEINRGEITRYVFTTSSDRSNTLDTKKAFLGQLYTSNDELVSEVVQRWPLKGEATTIVERASTDPNDQSKMVEALTGLSHKDI